MKFPGPALPRLIKQRPLARSPYLWQACPLGVGPHLFPHAKLQLVLSHSWSVLQGSPVAFLLMHLNGSGDPSSIPSPTAIQLQAVLMQSATLSRWSVSPLSPCANSSAVGVSVMNGPTLQLLQSAGLKHFLTILLNLSSAATFKFNEAIRSITSRWHPPSAQYWP